MKFKKCGSIAGCAASSKKIQKNFESSKAITPMKTSFGSGDEEAVEEAVQAVVVVFGVVGLRRERKKGKNHKNHESKKYVKEQLKNLYLLRSVDRSGNE